MFGAGANITLTADVGSPARGWQNAKLISFERILGWRAHRSLLFSARPRKAGDGRQGAACTTLSVGPAEFDAAFDKEPQPMTTSTLSSRPTRRLANSVHRFSLGQAVRLTGGFRTSGNIYIVTAILPPNEGSPQYHIRNEAEKFERMATQANLEPITAPAAVESGAAP